MASPLQFQQPLSLEEVLPDLVQLETPAIGRQTLVSAAAVGPQCAANSYCCCPGTGPITRELLCGSRSTQ